MSAYQPHVWYDFSVDRTQPLRLDVAGFERDADAVLCRDLRLATEMHARDRTERGRVLPLRRVTR